MRSTREEVSQHERSVDRPSRARADDDRAQTRSHFFFLVGHGISIAVTPQEFAMSLEARQALVNSPHTFFQSQSQRDDLLDPNKTQTTLIALLSDLVAKGWNIEFTAIRSDHHDDSALGEHCHAHGYCADCWPLSGPTAGAYLDANDPRFAQFCHDAGFDPNEHQVGLAGSAWTHANAIAAGSSVFQDSGADHVHLGSQ